MVFIKRAEGAVGGGWVVAVILEVLTCLPLCLQETPRDLLLPDTASPECAHTLYYTQVLEMRREEVAVD